ncbi:unnamed protein product, partial [marine sediment metagenome]
MRIILASILLSSPDIVLLDEPTNHLDTESLEWLEGWLLNFTGTIIVISHDRYFMDKLMTQITELAHQKLTIYQGNFSYYLKEKVKRQELLQKQAKNQQDKIAKTEAFIERFRYKNTKAVQVQSRIKMLEKMQTIKIDKQKEKNLPEDRPLVWFFDVAVIGGGPAGMMAAGRVAELGAKVVLIEKNEILGKKLLITGKGRCNFTHNEFDIRKFAEKFGRNGRFLYGALALFGAGEVIDFFESRGVKSKVEQGDRIAKTEAFIERFRYKNTKAVQVQSRIKMLIFSREIISIFSC